MATMKETKAEIVKTTIRLPRPIWRDANVRALDERRDFQEVVALAVALYLKQPLKVKEGK